MTLIADKEYLIKHRRKGTFQGVCLDVCDGHATLRITKGVNKGAIVTVLAPFCEFKEVKP